MLTPLRIQELVDTKRDRFSMLWLHYDEKVPLGCRFELQSQPFSLLETAGCYKTIKLFAVITVRKTGFMLIEHHARTLAEIIRQHLWQNKFVSPI